MLGHITTFEIPIEFRALLLFVNESLKRYCSLQKPEFLLKIPKKHSTSDHKFLKITKNCICSYFDGKIKEIFKFLH